MAKDRAGIVQTLSDAVYSHQGNWLESSLSRLGGQFAGIVSVNIPEDSLDDFKKALADIVADGISVRMHAQDSVEEELRRSAKIIVEGNDRRGIIEELSSVLVEKNVNVEKLVTQFESASMAGYDLFRAEIDVTLPKRFTVNKLETLLENISDDLMVNIEP
jgi:glycine cleavage system regulatory protein